MASEGEDPDRPGPAVVEVVADGPSPASEPVPVSVPVTCWPPEAPPPDEPALDPAELPTGAGAGPAGSVGAVAGIGGWVGSVVVVVGADESRVLGAGIAGWALPLAPPNTHASMLPAWGSSPSAPCWL